MVQLWCAYGYRDLQQQLSDHRLRPGGNTTESTIPYTITTSDCPGSINLPVFTTGTACVTDEEGLNWSGTSLDAWMNLYTGTPGSSSIFARVNAGANTDLRTMSGSYRRASGPAAIVMPEGQVRLNRSYSFSFWADNFSQVTQTTHPVAISFVVSAQDMDDLLAASPGGGLTSLRMPHTDDACGEGLGTNATELPVTVEHFTCASDVYRLTFSATEFSTFYLVVTDAGLPVELSSFTAEVLPKQEVALAWTTATESGNHQFVVEHSVDGRNFTALGAVAGAGESTEVQWYAYLHENPFGGNNYYRLRQVDLDGTETLSEVRRVYLEAVNGLSVYPNPANERLYFRTEMDGPVSITDLRGRRLLNAGAAGADGLYVGDLPSGVYLLRCGEEVVRWVKR